MLLEMKDIVKDFPGVRALDHVNLTLDYGEILGLVGENGAGKSTLMQILSGVHPAGSYQGEICIDGELYKVSQPSQSVQYGIEMIYQEVSLHLDMTVSENLAIGRWQNKRGFVDWKKIRSDAQEVLKSIRLNVDPDAQVRTLSTSQQQMIAIGRALSHKPRLLIMDEPTSSLTESETKVLFENLHALKQQGISIILISHKLDEIMAHTDRIVVMRDGKVVGEHITERTHPDEIVTETVGRKIGQIYPPKTNSPAGPVMRIENLTVRHPVNKNKNILEGINLTLRKNEVLGIAGLVGAGRSELLNAIFGLGGRIEGKIYLNDQIVQNRNPSESIKNGFALITENRKISGINAVASVANNIVMASYKKLSRCGWVNAREEKQEAEIYRDELHIKAPSLSTLVGTLSGGNQQKVVLAKWLMTKPDILLLDDPTRGIDVGTKNDFYKMIDTLACSGVSCIVVSSEMPELMAMSNRIVVLAGGKIRGEFEREDFDEHKIMNLAMGV